jgi:hypothetical protein
LTLEARSRRAILFCEGYNHAKLKIHDEAAHIASRTVKDNRSGPIYGSVVVHVHMSDREEVHIHVDDPRGHQSPSIYGNGMRLHVPNGHPVRNGLPQSSPALKA